jgi:hypothetical protein
MRRPRWRTLINGSSRAYIDAGPDTAYGSEPPFDEDEDFDPVAEKHIERLEAVEDAAERLAAEVVKLETEARRAVAAQILTERKLKRGKSTEAERVAREHCRNLARRLNPDESNLDRAVHSEIYRELRVYKDGDLQRLPSARKD